MIIGDIFSIIIVEPFYNLLIFITNFIPGNDIGISVILLTVLVKTAILPITHRGVKTQGMMRKIDPEIKKLKEKYKNNQQQQATQIMNLYKQHGINPFSGCLMALIQLPIIFGLYWVFFTGFQNGGLNTNLLYSFVEIPQNINFEFLGVLDIREKSVVFAVLAGVFQFLHMRITFPSVAKDEKNTNDKKSFTDELKKSMGVQMKYILPVIIIFVSLGFPSAVPLYWISSTLFSISHELLVKKKAKDLLSDGHTPQS